MPTAVDETPNRVCMMAPSRLVLAAAARGVVLRRRIGPLAFRKRLLRRSRVQQHAEQPVVALVATTLEDEGRLVVGLLELLHGRPRLRPRRGVLGGELDLQGVRVGPAE